MSLDNNKTSIIKSWIAKYHRTGFTPIAQDVEEVTGDYPDHPLYVSRNEKPEGTEDELIQERILNNINIY